MDAKGFYTKKLVLLTRMSTQLEAMRSTLAQLSQHEGTSPDPEHSEFFFLGDALSEAAAQLDGLTSAVTPLVQTYNR